MQVFKLSFLTLWLPHQPMISNFEVYETAKIDWFDSFVSLAFRASSYLAYLNVTLGESLCLWFDHMELKLALIHWCKLNKIFRNALLLQLRNPNFQLLHILQRYNKVHPWIWISLSLTLTFTTWLDSIRLPILPFIFQSFHSSQADVSVLISNYAA